MKSKFTKFLIMGYSGLALSLGGLLVTSASMSQSDLYNDVITKPKENIQQFFNIDNPIKNKYQSFINSDKEILSQLKVPDDILNVRVILKSPDAFDKAFFPLMKFGHWAFNWGDDQKALAKGNYDGNNSMYSSIADLNNKVIRDYIIIGTNALEDKEIKLYQGLYEIFGNSDEKMTSFVFFHEFSHKLGNSLKNNDDRVQEIYNSFEKDKRIILNKEDKANISTKYSETFADTLALMIMTKKYPEMNFEKTRDMLSGLRSSFYGNHLTSPGLVETIQPDKNASLEDMMISAEKSSLITSQFYSVIYFNLLGSNSTNTDIQPEEAKLIKIDRDSITEKIYQSRDKFLMNKNPTSLKPKQ